MARARRAPPKEGDLQHWKLLETFQQVLAGVVAQQGLAPTWQDPQRLLTHGQYLSLALFGLLNPVVQTMRGLCAASQLGRVQDEICGRSVSLGSFSEAQHLVEPALLAAVFAELSAQVPATGDPRLAQRPWQIVDSTLWEALPRMQWALWRSQGRQQQAVRLHVGYHLREQTVGQATVTAGRRCERAVWREQWRAGDCYVGDRNYGEDYGIFEQLTQRGCAFVLRLRENAVVRAVEQELALSAADQAAQVQRQAWVRLGGRGPGVRVRVVWVQTPRELLWLVTNVPETELPGELVAQLYRCRWQVELFFRWIKCILGNRHWLAESAAGVSQQLYLTLIAAVLLQLYTGRRPRRRTLELIQWYQLGWASAEELQRHLAAEQRRVAVTIQS